MKDLYEYLLEHSSHFTEDGCKVYKEALYTLFEVTDRNLFEIKTVTDEIMKK